jgi:hypothetical protein
MTPVYVGGSSHADREGGWGIDGHPNTGDDIVAAARASLQVKA